MDKKYIDKLLKKREKLLINIYEYKRQIERLEKEFFYIDNEIDYLISKASE